MIMSTAYFLPYLRKGLANSISSPMDKNATRAVVKVTPKAKMVDVNKVEKSVDLNTQTVELFGPADVKSLSKKAVSRMSPPSTGDVKLNSSYMPYVEFYEEDLPWRYTPVNAESGDFHPWLVLIAVKPDEMKSMVRNGVRIASLTLTKERYQEVFPFYKGSKDEKQLKKCAHVQLNVNIDGENEARDVNAILDENPDCGVARILCVSKLEQDTQYVALLVPAYEQGRLAGIGDDPKKACLSESAFPNLSEATIQRDFPVYLKWSFSTLKNGGTFKDLANKLFYTSEEEKQKMDAYLGVDITHSGLGYESDNDTEIDIDVPAALIPNKNVKVDKLRKEGDDYTKELKNLLLLSPVFSENENGTSIQDEDPWVVPPVYGARHKLTKREQLETESTEDDQQVVREVNLHLRNRVAAGMGSSVVKQNQEEFVNRAWKKVEVINTLNQLLREFYQMQQVNDRASSKYYKPGDVDSDNQALLYNAAVRMLQTSGIYYNHVNPFKLPEITLEQDSLPGVNMGLDLNYLKALYDVAETWQPIIDEERKFDAVYKSLCGDNAWDSDFLNKKYSVLSECFTWNSVTGNGKKTFFFTAKHLEISPKTILSCDATSFKEVYDVLNSFQKDNGYWDFTDLYQKIEGLLEQYAPIFENNGKENCAVDKDGNLISRTYPIRLTVKYNGGEFKGRIVEDAFFEQLGESKDKPFIVEYYKDESSYSKGEKQKYFFISKSYFDEQNHTFLNKLCETAKGNGMYPTSGFLYGNSKFSHGKITPIRDTMHNSGNGHCWYVSSHITGLLRNQGGSYGFDNKKYGSKYEKTKLQIKYYNNNTFDTSYKGKTYPWLRWRRDDAKKRGFVDKCIEGNKKVSFYINCEKYREVLDEFWEKLDKVLELLAQPSDVVITILENVSSLTLTADKIFDYARKDSDSNDSSVDMDDNEHKVLLGKVKEISESIDEEFNKDKKTVENSGNNNQKEKDEEDIDPEKLAEERIQEICKKYGITEQEQLKDVDVNSKYPVMVYPDFLDPTFFYLRELSIDYVLPSSDALRKNSITKFYSNPAFEEAFLMGVNTEMGKELLWREYPTDQRGSYFRKFWDQTTLPKKEDIETKYFDVKKLHEWKGGLGNNHNGKEQMLVFAIKGELMAAFPDTDIYLEMKNGEKPILASMASWLTEDTYLVGFEGVKDDFSAEDNLVFKQKPLSLQFTQSNPENILFAKTNYETSYEVVKACCFYLPLNKK